MKTTLTKVMAYILAPFLLISFAYAQEIITTAGTVSVCPGAPGQVTVPITVQNFTNVYSISLSLIIQTPAHATYVSYTVNPVISGSGGFLMVNAPGNKVKAAFFGLSPVSLPDYAVLFNFTFNYSGGTPLVWDVIAQGDCQYSDFLGNPLPGSFVDGAILASLPDANFFSTPSVCSGGTSTVTVDFTAGVAPYTFVYNDGSGDVSVTTSTNPYTFNQVITSNTTWNLISITDGTGCANNSVNKTTTTNIISGPTQFNVGGGGGICAGKNSVSVTLDGSEAGLLYELYLDGVYTGTALNGTGDALEFPGLSTPGVYTITSVGDCGTVSMTGYATIESLPGPSVTLDAFSDICSSAEPFILTGGLPLGGVYSGIGVDNGTFYPNLVGEGIYTITYTYTDDNNCTGFAEQTITVWPLPQVWFDMPASFCMNDLAFELPVTPPGGEYSGDGVVGGFFNPFDAGVGIHTITLTVTDEHGCIGTYSIDATVNPIPDLIFNLPVVVCINADPVLLIGIPEGGWFEGTGVTDNYFFPQDAGLGLVSITYHYTNEFGCSNSASSDITVVPLTELTITPVAPLCVDATAVTLEATPAGGTFSGDGVTDGIFYPSATGSGVWTVNYSFYNENGCYSTTSMEIIVHGLPGVDIDGLGPFCFNADPVALYGYPEGGTFSGQGVDINIFNPYLAGPGVSTVTYSFTDEFGCSNSATTDVTVNPLPDVTITNPAALETYICLNADALELTGEPVGGNFEGEGVFGDWFYPGSAGEGNWTISYTYTNEFGCSTTVSHQIIVLPLPEVTIDPVGPLCADAEAVVLTGYPTGGTFSGDGVIDGSFFPTVTGEGVYTVEYTYTDGSGCTVTASIQIEVIGLPNVYIDPVYPVCIDADPISLYGSPEGGTFTGDGMVGNIFVPSAAGAGTHLINYAYTHENGCSNTFSIEITVNPLPVVTFEGTLATQCVSNEYYTLTGGNPEGGYYSGDGVFDNNFDALVAGVGVHVVSYNYTDINGCTNTATNTIEVVDLPVVTWVDALPGICENNGVYTLTGATPDGGVYSGTGVDGNTFNPFYSGVGSFLLTYTYTDQYGCSNFATNQIEVFPIPTVYIYNIPTLCETGDPFVLSGYPDGGVFSGPGIVDGVFYPGIYGPGEYEITFSYTDAFGCSNNTNATVVVEPTPVVDFILPATVCLDGSYINLEGTPEGGTFVGIGVEGNTFSTSGAGAGTWTVTYEYYSPAGCFASVSHEITVNPLPEVSIVPIGHLCADNDPVELTGIPAGGQFSGDGVEGNMFVPSSAFIGANNIQYTYTDEFGCSNTAYDVVYVHPVPDLFFVPVGTVFETGDPVTLQATPAGGTFYGTGVVDNVFYPGIAGVGTFEITYIFISEYGCSNTVTELITVAPFAEIVFNPIADVCQNAEPVELIATPEGGVFDGPGVVGNMFYPTLTGPGYFTLSYTLGAGYAEQTVFVNPAPEVFFDQIAPICVNAGMIELTALPEGGTFAGAGVVGNFFDPGIGTGTYTVVYTVTNEFGCSASQSIDIMVVPVPDIIFDPIGPVCVNGGPVTLVAYPEGGNFGGIGVEGNVFNPDVAGVGEWSVIYIYVDGYGCYNSTEITIVVNPGATITIDPLGGPFCANADPVPLVGTPEGGEFSGPGVVGGIFYPELAGAGTHTITYTNSLNGCGGSASTEVTVYPVPMVQLDYISPICAGNASAVTVTILSPVESGPWVLGLGNGMEMPVTDLVSTHELLPTETTTYTLDYITNVYGCTNILNLSYTVVVNPLPQVFTLSGGGSYCPGGNGVSLQLSGSEAGYQYWLYLDGTYTGTSVTGDGNPLLLESVTAPGVYTIMATSPEGCENLMDGSASVAIYPELFASAGTDANITLGETIMLNGSAWGGTGNYFYTWAPAATLNDPTIANPEATPVETTVYGLMVMDEAGCMASDEVTVNVFIPQNNIFGVAKYNNTTGYPNLLVNLYTGGDLFASTYTDPNGGFTFLDLPNGDYTVIPDPTLPWASGNAADGLLMLKHFTGKERLTGLKLIAGDVTGNGAVNAHDALNDVKRFVGMLSDFLPVGDWVWTSASVTIDGLANQNVSLNLLCTGDVNGDYPISGGKIQPSISIVNQGVAHNFNGEIILPVNAEMSLTVGAISLILNVPAGVEVTGASVKGEEVIFHQKGTEVRLGWYNLEPIVVNSGETLLTLKLRNNADLSQFDVTVDAASTLSDDNAVTIVNARLSIPSYTTASSDMGIYNFPNPFSQLTQIIYNLPEDGNVSLKVYNVVGAQVAELINKEQSAGSYQLTFDGSALEQGIYIYKLEFSNTNLKTQKTGMMNISK
ncbi:MAG: T9SS type A sorting domain-containing protein [Bacteroidetes bacterium]|nr:T9SS type A sorting domain-containing protein [Bacteroidota bacterium]